MYDPDNNMLATPTANQPAPNARFSESGPGVIPISENKLQPDAFLAFDDGTLAEVPYALDAWLDQQQHALT